MSTADFSERLKKGSTNHISHLTAARTRNEDDTDRQIDRKLLSSVQLESLAWRMAMKTYKGEMRDNIDKPRHKSQAAIILAQKAATRTDHRRALQVASAAAHFAGDLTLAGSKGSSGKSQVDIGDLLILTPAPIAFFYNVANGFRNFPSYSISHEVHRQRDEIAGLSSGLTVAGKVCLNICSSLELSRPISS